MVKVTEEGRPSSEDRHHDARSILFRKTRPDSRGRHLREVTDLSRTCHGDMKSTEVTPKRDGSIRTRRDGMQRPGASCPLHVHTEDDGAVMDQGRFGKACGPGGPHPVPDKPCGTPGHRRSS